MAVEGLTQFFGGAGICDLPSNEVAHGLVASDNDMEVNVTIARQIEDDQHVARDGIPQGRGDGVARGPYDSAVELEVRKKHVAKIVGARSHVHPFYDPIKFCRICLVGTPIEDCVAQEKRLEHQPDFKHPVGGLGAKRRDPIALMPSAGEDALGMQYLEGLAGRDTAGVELLGEGRLNDPLAGPQAARCDRLGNGIGNRFCKRRTLWLRELRADRSNAF